jgi:hypothetical protein
VRPTAAWCPEYGLSDAPENVTAVRGARNASGWSGLYFGGIPLKQQPFESCPSGMVAEAIAHVDVITTSAPAGAERFSEELRQLRATVGVSPIAVTGEITLESLERFLPYADCILATAPLRADPAELDARETTLLAEAVHRWAARRKGRLASAQEEA